MFCFDQQVTILTFVTLSKANILLNNKEIPDNVILIGNNKHQLRMNHVYGKYEHVFVL